MTGVPQWLMKAAFVGVMNERLVASLLSFPVQLLLCAAYACTVWNYNEKKGRRGDAKTRAPPVAAAVSMVALSAASVWLTVLLGYSLVHNGYLFHSKAYSQMSSMRPGLGSHLDTLEAHALTLFRLSKIVEFIDTYWQTKRGFRVTRLHAVHHATVPLLCCAYSWDGGVVFLYGASLNSFVHIWMYAYYACAYAAATSGKKVPCRSLLAAGVWSMQVSQFCIMLGYGCYAFLVVPSQVLEHLPWSLAVSFSVYLFYLVEFLAYGKKRFWEKRRRKKNA